MTDHHDDNGMRTQRMPDGSACPVPWVWGLLSLLTEMEDAREALAAARAALEKGRLAGGDAGRKAFAVLIAALDGRPPSDEDLETLARAFAEDPAGRFEGPFMALLRCRVEHHLHAGEDDAAIALTERLEAASGGRAAPVSQLKNAVSAQAGFGLLQGSGRKIFAERLEATFRANPRDWVTVHSLALLYWNWAIAEETKPRRGFESAEPDKNVEALCPDCHAVCVVSQADLKKKWKCHACEHVFALEDRGTWLDDGLLFRARDGMASLRCPRCKKVLRASGADSPDVMWSCDCGNMVYARDFVEIDVLWRRAVGFWAYLLGPCWEPFAAWFIDLRRGECGLALNEDQVKDARRSIRDQIHKVIHGLTEGYREQDRREGMARMRLLDAQMRLEQRFARLLEKELLPYVRERAADGAGRLAEPASNLVTAGPTLLILLGQDRPFLALLDAIESSPPSEEPDDESQMQDLLRLLANTGLGGDALQRKRSPSRLVRHHNAALAQAEEMAAYLTPIGPLMVMAQEGDPHDVKLLRATLTEKWRDSAVARYSMGLAYSRAGDLAVGRGVSRITEAIEQWRQALGSWAEVRTRAVTAFRARSEFSSSEEYGAYVKATLRLKMRVRALISTGPVRKGDLGTYYGTSTGFPPCFVVWDRDMSSKSRLLDATPPGMGSHAYWVEWHDVEMVSEEQVVTVGDGDFLTRRVPLMIDSARAKLEVQAAQQVIRTCKSCIDAANGAIARFREGGEKDPDLLATELLEQPIEAMRAAHRMYTDFSLSSDTLAGNLADALHTRAFMRFTQANKRLEQGGDRSANVELLLAAEKDLLEAARVYPPTAERYKNEAAIVRRQIEDILGSRQGGSGSAPPGLSGILSAFQTDPETTWKVVEDLYDEHRSEAAVRALHDLLRPLAEAKGFHCRHR